jgi:putative membrane-bound dehydrogenase-like protein
MKSTLFAIVLLAAPLLHADTLATLSVPKGFTVELAAGPDLSSYPMFMEFDEQGRMYIAESTGKDLSGQEMAAAPECVILRLEDTNDDGVFDTRSVFADELSLPMGVLWHQGSLYVASPPDFVRFKDNDGDGVAEEREVLLTGWNVFNTASLHGPFAGPDGRLYLTHGRHGYKITTKEGELLEGLASRIWRCLPDGTQLERFAGGGFDNPVELVFTPGGEIIGTMTYFTDPKLGQRDALMHFVWGGVYPKPHESTAEFVRTGSLMPVMSKYARIAPSGLMQYRGEAFGAEYQGSLFSAQFNPHRVQRHRMIEEGASWRTEDEDFLISSNPDFYPTDVIEAADGSILVSDTGAWYVDACPISRVAKPEVRGGIYRIRKKEASRVHDAWGNTRNWDTVESLAEALAASSPAMRERALERLVALGADSRPVLLAALQSQSPAATRLLALSGLYRIAPEGDSASFITALEDPERDVRTLAARLLGDIGGDEAVGPLVARLRTGDAPERMAAASALGRIGEAAAVPALLEAAETADDRFQEHAIIFALIELAEEQLLADALGSAAWGTRKAALIALDQLGHRDLEAAHVLPFLEAENATLRADALWVASRHADWAEDILEFVEARLRGDNPAERETLREILLAYAHTETGQERIAAMLRDDAAPSDLRAYLLECIDAAPVQGLPDAWRDALNTCLRNDDSTLRAGALAVIQSRGYDAFDKPLGKMADDVQEESMLRLAAMTALARGGDTLSPKRLDFALEHLQPDTEPLTRRAASGLLATATLDSSALHRMIAEQMPGADSLALSTMLACVEKGSDPEVGDAFLQSLIANADALKLLSMTQIENALKPYPDATRAHAESLRGQFQQQEDGAVQRFLALTPRLGTGDVGRGRDLFFSEKAQCSLCHAVGEEGGALGPDLTTIGLVRSAHDLLESVVFPSSSMVPDYVPYLVDTEFESFSGIILAQSANEITLATAVNEVRRIPRAEVTDMRPAAVSMMPQGLDAGFTDEELVDLVAFLQSLNNEPWLIPQRWEGKEHTP